MEKDDALMALAFAALFGALAPWLFVKGCVELAAAFLAVAVWEGGCFLFIMLQKATPSTCDLKTKEHP